METRRKKHFVDKDYDEKLNLENQNKRVCKHCGYSVLLPSYKNKILCKHCGYLIFRNEEDEIEYRKDERSPYIPYCSA